MLTQSELDSTSIVEKNENTSTDEEQQLQLQSLKPRRVIAKTKANNRKGYKRKVLEIQPIIYQQIAFLNKYMLYGFIEVENFYKDYPSPYEKELVDNSEILSGIVSVQKSIKDSNVTINTYTKQTNCLRQFQFLIDHFAQIPDQNYQMLSDQLNQYQKIVNSYINHSDNLKIRLKQRLISEEEIREAFAQYRTKFEEFAQSQIQEDEFYIISYSQLNLDLFEFEQVYTKLSFALISLLGVEPQNCEAAILRSSSNYLDQFGLKRLEATIKNLFMMTSQQLEFEFQEQYQTIDKINFFGSSHMKLFYWEERPEWMRYEDCIGVVAKLNISLGQLRSILEIRSQMSPSKELEYGITHDDDYYFEYSIQSEIFLEKYYSEIFKNVSLKQSLNIKQSLLQKMNEEDAVEQDKLIQYENETNQIN